MTAALSDRSQYPTLTHFHYMNQASLGLVGGGPVATMHRFLDDVARHGNVHMSDEEESGFLDGLRGAASTLLGVDPAKVAVTAGASELLGQAPGLLRPPRGSEVVVVATDFPAITRPWLRLADHGGCRVRFVDDDPASDLTSDLIAAIGDDTAVVAVATTQYATGSRIDVDRLTAAIRGTGVRLVLDITQDAGAMRAAPSTWEADLVACSGYKWLGGHGGAALGVVAPVTLGEAPPLPGWMGAIDPFDFDASRADYAPDARRFTLSTMSYVSVVGLTESIDELASLDIARVEEHSDALARHLVSSVASSGWIPFRELDDPAAGSHIVSLGHAELDAARAARSARSAGVVCGARLGRIRVSLAHYNDETDVDALVSFLT